MGKFRKWLSLLLLMSSAITMSAQYSFQVTLHGAGSKACQQAAAQVSQAMQSYGSLSGFPNRSACEQVRSAILSIRANSPYCNVYYTATPCTGTDMTNIGSTNPLAPPVSNPANDIRDQAENYDYLREIQDPASSIEYILVNGDAVFAQDFNNAMQERYGPANPETHLQNCKKLISDPAHEAKILAKRLLDKKFSDMTDLELSDFFKSEYQQLTGVDIDEVLLNIHPSLEDEAIIKNYNEYVNAVLDTLYPDLIAAEENRNYPEEDMAIYSLDVYNSDNGEDIEISQYLSELPKPIRDGLAVPDGDRDKVLPIIDLLNEYRDKWGFQADLYHDDKTDKYILSFRGTETGRGEILKDFSTDGLFALFGVSPQHNKSYSLADAIINSGLPKDKLVITGHSLGGGLAVLAGLKSGYTTYAYNPQHVSVDALSHYNLDLSPEKQLNIHVYTAARENVVHTLESAAAEVKKHPVANAVMPVAGTINAVSTGLAKSVLRPEDKDDMFLKIGIQHTVYTDEGSVSHFQVPMVKAIKQDVKQKKEDAVMRIRANIGRLKSTDSPVLRQKSSLSLIKVSDKDQFAKPGVAVKIISRK